jgi:stage V sporulation protein B
MRFVKVIKVTGARAALCGTMVFPVILAFGTMSAVELFFRLTNTGTDSIHEALFFGIIWGGAYFAVFSALGKVKLFSKCGEEVFIDNAQQTVSRVI